METQAFTFAGSRFVPVAIGFFGLGTGYFIWGGQALFGFPKTSPEVNRTVGMWGFWMPGFMQFITGVYLLIGLTWFNVFGDVAPLYIAGLAFTAYGIHWFAMAHRRYIDSSAELDGDRVPLHQHSGGQRSLSPEFGLCTAPTPSLWTWHSALKPGCRLKSARFGDRNCHGHGDRWGSFN